MGSSVASDLLCELYSGLGALIICGCSQLQCLKGVPKRHHFCETAATPAPPHASSIDPLFCLAVATW